MLALEVLFLKLKPLLLTGIAGGLITLKLQRKPYNHLKLIVGSAFTVLSACIRPSSHVHIMIQLKATYSLQPLRMLRPRISSMIIMIMLKIELNAIQVSS